MSTFGPISLSGQRVRLRPLTLADHPALCEIGLVEELWQDTTIKVQTSADMLCYVQNGLREQAEGTCLPFVIIESSGNQIIGTSRYHGINKIQRRLEIGFTWIAIPWQRTAVNTEVKYLMLKHAFEQCGCVRVQFKADTSNQESRRALLRIGAMEEGVLRSYVISEHKGLRDLVVFSIISSEWPHVKTKLEALLSKYDDR